MLGLIFTVKLNDPVLSRHALISIGIGRREGVLKNGISVNHGS